MRKSWLISMILRPAADLPEGRIQGRDGCVILSRRKSAGQIFRNDGSLCETIGGVSICGFDASQLLIQRIQRQGSVHAAAIGKDNGRRTRSEEHTSELQSLMRISYAVFCLKKKTT